MTWQPGAAGKSVGVIPYLRARWDLTIVVRILVMLLLCLECALAFSQNSDQRTSHLDRSVMDLHADPCSDFYQYACGNYRTLHPLQGDEDYVFLADLTRPAPLAQMADLLSRPGGANSGAAFQSLHRFYGACITADSQGAASMQALRPLLQKISAYQRPSDLPALLTQLFYAGAAPFFRVTVEFEPDMSATQRMNLSPPSFSLARTADYNGTDEASVRAVSQLRDHARRVFLAIGDGERQAEQEAGGVVAIEARLAAGARNAVDSRDPRAHIHPVTLRGLRADFGNFDWQRFFSLLRVDPASAINLDNPRQLQSFHQLIASAPSSAVRAYLRYTLVSSVPEVITLAPVAKEDVRYARVATGSHPSLPRSQACLLLTIGARRDDVIRSYVEHFLPHGLKPSADEMVHAIRGQLAIEIASAAWLDEPTRQRALDKLNRMSQVIVYGSLGEQYDSVPVRSHRAVSNYLLAKHTAFRRELNAIGSPIDRTRATFHPLSTGAMYKGEVNTIEIPGAEWLPPSYDARADAAENYARSGFTVGHELIHAFDDEGRQRDGSGMLADWWTPDDAARFREKAACFVHEYETFGTDAEHHENGQLTLGENIADNGGLRLALLAYLADAREHGVPLDGKEDGWTPLQRFFLSYAQDTCSAVRPDSERLQMETNPHSLDRFRANGALQNMPEFGDAFSCAVNAPMRPSHPCRIW